MWAIKLGAVATTKRNATQNVEAGWNILIAKLCPAMGGGQAAEILFFAHKDDALEAARLIGGSPTTPSAQADMRVKIYELQYSVHCTQ